MADEKFTFLGQIKAKKGCGPAVRQILSSLIAKSRQEPGNIHYDLYQALDDDTAFLFHESWKNQKALDEHMQTDYVQAFVAKGAELLAEPVEGKKIKIID